MKKIFLSLFVFIFCYLLGCSLRNISGTETGNPDISAVLSSALSIFDTLDQWNPSYYLPEGEKQLNPEKISTTYHSYIAKKKVESSIILPDTEIMLITLIEEGKIILIDTLFFNDTITTSKEIEDSIYKETDGTTMLFINKKVVIDTFFLKDTIIKMDTLLITKDTASDSTILTNNKGEKITTVKGELSDSVLTKVLSYAIMVTKKGSEEVRIDTIAIKYNAGVKSHLYSSYTQDIYNILKTETDTYSITESYIDLDGDGTLFSVWSGGTAKATYNLYYVAENVEKVLKVDFDAGIDNIFVTTENNRIITLKYNYTSPTYFEEVLYGILYFGYHGDTLFLNRKIKRADSEKLTLYKCIRGNDTLNHRENKLISCISNVNFTSGGIKKYELIIRLDTPLSIGQKPSTAFLNSTIDFGKGNVGVIEATIDYINSYISGKYLQAGKEYSLRYLRSENKVHLEP
ncbi:MAG: hypothetical protein N2053_03405 [Chitinispirillaceae bacterium]|nr:hypothetical protein [Chitinispirillaceae bacterium]